MIVALREYGLLFEGSSPTHDLDQATIPSRAWQFFKRTLLTRPDLSPTFELTSRGGREAIRVKQYVGVWQAPDGTTVEVLPKIVDGPQDVKATRQLLLSMIQSLTDFPSREGLKAGMATDTPLLDVFIGHFLDEVQTLVDAGLRSGYQRLETQSPTLRSKLLVSQQLKYNACAPHRFFIAYDAFLPDRPENRIVLAALTRVRQISHKAVHQQRADALMQAFEGVSLPRDIPDTFRRFSLDRNTAHYRDALAWSRLLLNGQAPQPVAGQFEAVSLLFSMDRLFEAFVAAELRKAHPAWKLETQVQRRFLASHSGRGLFAMRPDLLWHLPTGLLVADTKWKRLNERVSKYDLNQADLYQMYAYGRKYFPDSAAERPLALIYPRTERFREAPPPFELESGMNLWVVPFDLDKRTLDGAWRARHLNTP